MSQELNVVKKKQNKKSLATLLLLVGSFVLALGASFAFFTDTAGGVSNTMTAATFDMVETVPVGLSEVDYGTDGLPGGGDDTYTPVTDGQLIVPGCTFKATGTVTNSGTVDMDIRVMVELFESDGVTPADPTEWTNTYATAEATLTPTQSYDLSTITGELQYNEANLNAVQGTSYEVKVTVQAKQSDHAEWTDISIFETK